MNDPDWDAFIPEMANGGAKCRMVAHADCSALDIEATSRHLESGGTLGSMPGYEVRPGQLDMLRAVTRAYNGRNHLMIEAGTGVGKSLAYIIPSVFWSFLNDTPVVISTATRNLQSQLTSADLPRAATVLGDDAKRFRHAVLKGRVNYLCLRALAEYMQGGWWTLNDDERAEFTRFLDWLYRTEDGDLDDFGGEELRKHVTCPSEDCWGHSCRYANKCFIARARARAMRAHVIVANHALVLAEAANPGSGLLPAYGRIVFDEAHNLEDIATDYFSYELSKPVLMQVLGRLARPGRMRRGVMSRPRGFLGAVERQLHKGLFPKTETEDLRELVNRAHVQSRFAVSAGDALFDVLKNLFAPSPKAEVIRYRVCENRRQYALRGLFADYAGTSWREEDLKTAALSFEDTLARLQGIVQELGLALQKAAETNELSLPGEMAQQAFGIVTQFTDFILETKCVLGGRDAERVFWAERVRERTGRDGRTEKSHLRLVAAPLSIAREMKRCFYDVKDTVVMCSATLRAGDRFDYMAHKLGLDLAEQEPTPDDEGADVSRPRVKALVAASPFDYFRQALTLAPDCLPDPAGEPQAYVEALGPFLAQLFFTTRGRGLVLFTSHDMMRRTADVVRERLESAGIDLLVQGEGCSREEMVRRLKAAESADRRVVLFGAQSFWEGVDVPGSALSCVVLTRLPFPQVGDPITAARGEAIVAAGGSEFRDFMLPEAIIRFRQGFGRLIRNERDRGVVVIADPRVVRKNYGASFRKAIAATVRTVTSLDDVLTLAGDFLADGQ